VCRDHLHPDRRGAGSLALTLLLLPFVSIRVLPDGGARDDDSRDDLAVRGRLLALRLSLGLAAMTTLTASRPRGRTGQRSTSSS